MSEIKSIKASERTRSHLTAPAVSQPVFDSIEELNRRGEEIAERVAPNTDKEYLNDVEKGLDINDPASIAAFVSNYTPFGDCLLVKLLRPERNVGNIILPDTYNTSTKAVVIVPGTMVYDVKRGDILILKGMDAKNDKPFSIVKNINGIDFKEIPYFSIAGIYMEREAFLKRANG
jgi:hypothetical protein